MEIKNTKGLTDYIFGILISRFDQLHWSLYPPIQDLKDSRFPCCTSELSSFEITRKYSDGRISADIQFSVQLIFKESQLSSFNLRDAAFAISAYLHRNNFNHPQIGEIEILKNEPDYFQPDIEGYLSWKLDFLVPFVCGESAYALNGISPDVEIDSRVHHD